MQNAMTNQYNSEQEMPIKVTILGGTGFIGRHLETRFNQRGDEVSAYGRDAFETQENLVNAINGADLLVILVGENIGKRWNKKVKQALFDSRIETSKQIKLALEQCDRPPKKILAASAIGIYPQNNCQQPLDEACQEVGKGVLAELGEAWEQATKDLSPAPTIMRFGVVLGDNGGALQKMLPAFRLGLGGPVAGGQQCFTWIHIDDLTRAIVYLAEKNDIEPVYNICSPNPLTNEEFGRSLAKTLNRPFFLPLPEWQLKLMFGEGAQVLTHSSAILPTRLINSGFSFEFETAQSALKDLLG